MTLIDLSLVTTFMLTLGWARSWMYKFKVSDSMPVLEYCNTSRKTRFLESSFLSIIATECVFSIFTIFLSALFQLMRHKLKSSEIDQIRHKLIAANRNLNGNDPNSVNQSLQIYGEMQEKLHAMKETSITLSCKASILGKVGYIYREMGRYDDCLECKREALQVSRQIREILANKNDI